MAAFVVDIVSEALIIGAVHVITPLGEAKALLVLADAAPVQLTHPLITPESNLIGAYPNLQLYPHMRLKVVAASIEQVAIKVSPIVIVLPELANLVLSAHDSHVVV